MSLKYVRIALIMLLFTLGCRTKVYCQLYFAEDMVSIKGRVIDRISNEAVGYAQVLNLRVRGGTMADALGNFSIQADPSDTLTFKSISYKDLRLPVSEIIASGKENAIVKMAPVRILIGEVEVEGNAPKVNMTGIKPQKYVPVSVELRSDYFASKPKILTAIFRPLSFLSYKLSKSEKEKRLALAAIRSERDWQILSLVYNKDVIQRISGLSGAELEDFMLYCNAFNGLPVNATNYDVEKRIKELKVDYNTEKLKGKLIK
jgi:hypothetical protein